MATSTISKRYTRLLALWPKDPLRPTQPFTRAIEYRGAPYGVTPVPIESPQDKSSPAVKSSPPRTAPSDPKTELAQINALYSLLENRYSSKYATSAEVLKPKSKPEYYELLMAEIARAPGKSWWQAKVDEWKGKIRWK